MTGGVLSPKKPGEGGLCVAEASPGGLSLEVSLTGGTYPA